MGWNPLDESLLSSSLLSEGPDVVATWALLIASANRHGESHLTVPFIASVLRISEERVEAAFKVLSSPDKRSRNKEHDGRRIVPAEDGWLLVSHSKYREKASRSAAADRQARYVERQKARKAAQATPVNVSVTTGTVSVPPANPLLSGRRPQMESEGYRLIREINALEPERDPLEILMEAAGWESKDGRVRTKCRLETMTDDHLIRTVRDLKSTLQTVIEESKHGSPTSK